MALTVGTQLGSHEITGLFTGMTVTGLGGFDLSPDGSRIAYSATTTRSRSELWALDNINFR